MDDDATVTVGEEDRDLAERLGRELHEFNVRATGVDGQRRTGRGARLLAAAEAEARSRGCMQVVVSSFTFQAPGFYQRHGYTEFGRTEGVPTAASADVHLVKALSPGAGR